MKKLIITDCFGVVTSELAPVWFAKRFPKKQAQELKERYFGNADLGGKSILQLMDDLSNGLGIEKSVIIKEFTEIFSLNVELLRYLREIKLNRSDCDVVLLSNAPQGLVESIFEKYGLYPYFDKVFVSWRYGIAKPNKRFYRLCLEETGGDYGEIFMIDDNPKNLENLSELNITPVLYVGNNKLFAYLDGKL